MQSRASRRRATRRTFHFNHSTQRPNIALRISLAVFLGLIMVTSGASAATLLYFNSVKLPPQTAFQKRLMFENTVIMAADRHTVLDDLADPSRGSRIVRPIELNPHNASQCPRGAHTKHLPIYYTCAGNGIPLNVREATIATEDPTFYSNLGFDPYEILRAAYQDATAGHIVAGGSTITQQLVKQYVLNNSAPTLSRKIQEIVLAYQLTRAHPKDYILYYYLNSVYYGDQTYGVAAAAQAYFHRDVSRLSLWQAAVLAGLPQSPSDYDPYNNPGPSGLWYTRTLEVLSAMVRRHYIGRSQETTAEHWAAAYTWHQTQIVNHMPFPGFANYVLDQFQQMDGPGGDPYLQQALGQKGLYDGLKIISTLSPQLQRLAATTVHSQVSLANATYGNITDGALVAMSSSWRCYGCILAMVGTANVDKKTTSVNMAVSPRQPGSSFKVFNYVSAFAKGLAPATTVLDAPISLPDGDTPYTPDNYDHLWHGVITLRQALANSLNIPALKVEVFNGVGRVAQTAKRMGITDLLNDNRDCCGWSLTLGGLSRGVRLVQETAAYGAFATEGMRLPPISFTAVVDRRTGKVLWQARKDTWLAAERHTRVEDAADTYLVTSILSDNSARCTPQVCEFGLNSPLLLDNPPITAAAKTGTTNDYRDNWTLGYTPQLVTGVWVGNADHSQMGGQTTGIVGAGPIWHDFMEKAYGILRLHDESFPVPPNVYSGSECRLADTTSFTPSTFSLDVYAGSVLPYCSVPSVSGVDNNPQGYNYGQYSQYAQPTAGPYIQPYTPPTTAPLQVQPANPPPVAPANPPPATLAPPQSAPAAPTTAPAVPSNGATGTGSTGTGAGTGGIGTGSTGTGTNGGGVTGPGSSGTGGTGTGAPGSGTGNPQPATPPPVNGSGNQ